MWTTVRPEELCWNEGLWIKFIAVRYEGYFVFVILQGEMWL